MDPTLLAVLSSLSGVAITAAAGFIGAWIQGRREHQKWLRDQRYEAFVRLLVLMRSIVAARKEMHHLSEKIQEAKSKGVPLNESTAAEFTAFRQRFDETAERFGEVAAPMRLLGTSGVDSTLNAQVPLLIGDDEAKASEAEKAIVAAMRKAVGVKY